MWHMEEVIVADGRLTPAGNVCPACGRAERMALSVQEVAFELGVSDDIVYELAQLGQIPAIRLSRGPRGGRWIIPILTFRSWLDEQGRAHLVPPLEES
jgi:excisionase family DNA binding protein